MDNKENKMDLLWAPWRMAYVTSSDKEKPASKKTKLKFLPNADENCFICQGAVCPKKEFGERFILQRTELVIVLLNRFPYNNGHLLVAPRRHVARLDLLSPEEWKELSDKLTFWTTKIEKIMNCDGFNVGLNLGRVAGAGLPGHLHWHIVPRWNGDTNFITTIGSTKAIPQSLESLWEILSLKH